MCVCVCVCVCTNLHGQCGNILYDLSLYIYTLLYYIFIHFKIIFQNYLSIFYINICIGMKIWCGIIWYYIYIYIYIIYGTMILLERTSIGISSGHLLKFQGSSYLINYANHYFPIIFFLRFLFIYLFIKFFGFGSPSFGHF